MIAIVVIVAIVVRVDNIVAIGTFAIMVIKARFANIARTVMTVQIVTVRLFAAIVASGVMPINATVANSVITDTLRIIVVNLIIATIATAEIISTTAAILLLVNFGSIATFDFFAATLAFDTIGKAIIAATTAGGIVGRSFHAAIAVKHCRPLWRIVAECCRVLGSAASARH